MIIEGDAKYCKNWDLNGRLTYVSVAILEKAKADTFILSQKAFF